MNTGAATVKFLYGHETAAKFNILSIQRSLVERKGKTQCRNELSENDCIVGCSFNSTKTLCDCSALMMATPSLNLTVIDRFNFDVSVIA